MTTATCVHHWVIETATGPTSPGYCKLCRETREFNNSVVDKGYGHWAEGSLARSGYASSRGPTEDGG